MTVVGTGHTAGIVMRRKDGNKRVREREAYPTVSRGVKMDIGGGA